MEFRTLKIVIAFLCVFLISCGESQNNDNYLFEKFQNPAADARPMVRWWWNGNCVEAEEIRRELELMKEAGIGGVEINSIAMPPGQKRSTSNHFNGEEKSGLIW